MPRQTPGDDRRPDADDVVTRGAADRAMTTGNPELTPLQILRALRSTNAKGGPRGFTAKDERELLALVSSTAAELKRTDRAHRAAIRRQTAITTIMLSAATIGLLAIAAVLMVRLGMTVDMTGHVVQTVLTAGAGAGVGAGFRWVDRRRRQNRDDDRGSDDTD